MKKKKKKKNPTCRAMHIKEVDLKNIRNKLKSFK